MFQRRVEHRLELQLVLDHHEAAARAVSRQRRGEVFRVDRFLRRFPLPNEILIVFAHQIEEERFVRLQGQAWLHAVQLGIVAHRTDLGQHGSRDAESGQLPVPQVAKSQRWGGSVGRRLGRSRCRRIRFATGLVHLQRAGLGVDSTLVPFGPRVSVVVLVGPQEHVDVAVLRLEHDRPVALIDAKRAHGGIASYVDPLVVQTAGRGVGVEPGDELPDAALLRPGQSRERVQKITGHRHFRSSGHQRPSRSRSVQSEERIGSSGRSLPGGGRGDAAQGPDPESLRVSKRVVGETGMKSSVPPDNSWRKRSFEQNPPRHGRWKKLIALSQAAAVRASSQCSLQRRCDGGL